MITLLYRPSVTLYKDSIEITPAKVTNEKHLLLQITKGFQMRESQRKIEAVRTSRPTQPQSQPQTYYNKETLRNCTPKFDPSKIKTSFKFYIYDLPSKFNHDIQRLFTDVRQFAYCYNLDYCGMGEDLSQTDAGGHTNKTTNQEIMSIRNTHQFALEVVIHYKLLHSPYRTTDPNQADMFYIPAYAGLNCLTFKEDSKLFAKEVFEHLEKHEAKNFRSGKPHFSTLSKIQREQGSDLCPTLKHPATQNITFFTIEKESNPNWSKYRQIYGTSVIVAPYPGYVHFTNYVQDISLSETKNGLHNLANSKFQLLVPSLSDRHVTLFLAAGTRRSNSFRAKLLDQFKIQTNLHPAKFYTTKNSTKIDQVMLITRECSHEHRITTIPWMLKSVFCLQPPGDSPTRKSIYDSILSGCIPVFFTNSFTVEYPFQKYIKYETFSYTIDEKLISRYNKNVYDILKELPQKLVNDLHTNLLKVAKWFQYSLPNGDIQWDDDAMTLLLHQVTNLYNLTTIPISLV